MSQTPSATPPTPPNPPTPPPFDPAAEHHRRPKVRSVRGIPVEGQTSDGKKVQMLGLADAHQVSDQMVITAPASRFILPKMDGTRDIDQIIAEIGQGLARPFVEQLVTQLDAAGLIEGPTFQAMLTKMRSEFDASPTLPPAATAAFVDGLMAQALGANATDEQRAEAAPQKLRELFDQYIKAALEKAENPSFDTLPKAIVAPHLDYPRGWQNYASVYGRLRVVDRPARVVILGTNHFGQSTGVCGCDKGFQTVLGTSPADEQMIAALRGRLGEALFENRFDHEREHSIELHIPWIQHVFGVGEGGGSHVPVFGVLIHDPSVNNGESYDGSGVGLNQFVAALKEAIAQLPGPTLVISSVDLSHVGPGFGDQVQLLGDEAKTVEFRNGVLNHDREMLNLIISRKPAELVAAMAWQQNPTRWCSTGALVATLLAIDPAEVQLLSYNAAIDQQGTSMVSSVAMAMR
ncbi:MAG: AmmeMemoRadiSam system protein B [Phycisphaerales bacterium]|nr:AmmeMemoRadiSam system protein B [Phycisphaerales bacterium]